MKWLGILLVLPAVLIGGRACFAQGLDEASMARLREQIKDEVLNEIRKEYKLVPKEEAVAKPAEKYVTEDKVRQLVEEVAEEKKFVTAEWAKGLTFGGLAQRLTFQGFGDVTFRANEAGGRFDKNHEDNNFFALGGLDLFITSQISERISFLNESVFEFEEKGAVLDVERLLIKYVVEDYLKITVGRVHTGLGYWNQAYHHGSWLQTTIDRPDVYRFEDDNGLLPVHAVGIELSGTYDFGPFDLDYIFNVANGRGEIVDKVQMVNDINDSKAVGLMVSIKPEIMPGLFFGGNFYLDDIPAKTDAPSHGEIDELIIGGHVGYLYSNWEFLLEGFNIEHDDNDATNHEYSTLGAYAQVAYRFGQWKPYYRYDLVQFNKRDPFYFTSFGELSDVNRHTLGIRYDITTFNAIKLEYNHLDASDGGNMDSFALNTSFSF